MQITLRLEGAIYGALIGNALGARCVTKKITKSIISQQLARQYTEAGAMSLCSMTSLIDSNRLDAEDMTHEFHEWYIGSYMAATKNVQIRTNVSQALRTYMNGMPPDRCGSKKTPSDNSALMRMLPIALWNAKESISTIILDAHEVSKITNQQVESQVCSALYCLIIRRFLLEKKEKASNLLISFYKENMMIEHIKVLNNFHQICKKSSPKGTSEVFDCLWSVSSIFAKNNKKFENSIVEGIMLGNDCEVTGLLIGSLAGISLGVNEIPQRWLNQLDLSNEAQNAVTNFIKIIKEFILF